MTDAALSKKHDRGVGAAIDEAIRALDAAAPGEEHEPALELLALLGVLALRRGGGPLERQSLHHTGAPPRRICTFPLRKEKGAREEWFWALVDDDGVVSLGPASPFGKALVHLRLDEFDGEDTEILAFFANPPSSGSPRTAELWIVGRRMVQGNATHFLWQATVALSVRPNAPPGLELNPIRDDGAERPYLRWPSLLEANPPDWLNEQRTFSDPRANLFRYSPSTEAGLLGVSPRHELRVDARGQLIARASNGGWGVDRLSFRQPIRGLGLIELDRARVPDAASSHTSTETSHRREETLQRSTAHCTLRIMGLGWERLLVGLDASPDGSLARRWVHDCEIQPRALAFVPSEEGSPQALIAFDNGHLVLCDDLSSDQVKALWSRGWRAIEFRLDLPSPAAKPLEFCEGIKRFFDDGASKLLERTATSWGSSNCLDQTLRQRETIGWAIRVALTGLDGAHLEGDAMREARLGDIDSQTALRAFFSLGMIDPNAEPALDLLLERVDEKFTEEDHPSLALLYALYQSTNHSVQERIDAEVRRWARRDDPGESTTSPRSELIRNSVTTRADILARAAGQIDDRSTANLVALLAERAVSHLVFADATRLDAREPNERWLLAPPLATTGSVSHLIPLKAEAPASVDAAIAVPRIRLTVSSAQKQTLQTPHSPIAISAIAADRWLVLHADGTCAMHKRRADDTSVTVIDTPKSLRTPAARTARIVDTVDGPLLLSAHSENLETRLRVHRIDRSSGVVSDCIAETTVPLVAVAIDALPSKEIIEVLVVGGPMLRTIRLDFYPRTAKFREAEPRLRHSNWASACGLTAAEVLVGQRDGLTYCFTRGDESARGLRWVQHLLGSVRSIATRAPCPETDGRSLVAIGTSNGMLAVIDLVTGVRVWRTRFGWPVSDLCWAEIAQGVPGLLVAGDGGRLAALELNPRDPRHASWTKAESLLDRPEPISDKADVRSFLRAFYNTLYRLRRDGPSRSPFAVIREMPAKTERAIALRVAIDRLGSAPALIDDDEFMDFADGSDIIRLVSHLPPLAPTPNPLLQQLMRRLVDRVDRRRAGVEGCRAALGIGLLRLDSENLSTEQWLQLKPDDRSLAEDRALRTNYLRGLVRSIERSASRRDADLVGALIEAMLRLPFEMHRDLPIVLGTHPKLAELASACSVFLDALNGGAVVERRQIKTLARLLAAFTGPSSIVDLVSKTLWLHATKILPGTPATHLSRIVRDIQHSLPRLRDSDVTSLGPLTKLLRACLPERAMPASEELLSTQRRWYEEALRWLRQQHEVINPTSTWKRVFDVIYRSSVNRLNTIFTHELQRVQNETRCHVALESIPRRDGDRIEVALLLTVECPSSLVASAHRTPVLDLSSNATEWSVEGVGGVVVLPEIFSRLDPESRLLYKFRGRLTHDELVIRTRIGWQPQRERIHGDADWHSEARWTFDVPKSWGVDARFIWDGRHPEHFQSLRSAILDTGSGWSVLACGRAAITEDLGPWLASHPEVVVLDADDGLADQRASQSLVASIAERVRVAMHQELVKRPGLPPRHYLILAAKTVAAFAQTPRIEWLGNLLRRLAATFGDAPHWSLVVDGRWLVTLSRAVDIGELTAPSHLRFHRRSSSASRQAPEASLWREREQWFADLTGIEDGLSATALSVLGHDLDLADETAAAMKGVVEKIAFAVRSRRDRREIEELLRSEMRSIVRSGERQRALLADLSKLPDLDLLRLIRLCDKEGSARSDERGAGGHRAATDLFWLRIDQLVPDLIRPARLANLVRLGLIERASDPTVAEPISYLLRTEIDEATREDSPRPVALRVHDGLCPESPLATRLGWDLLRRLGGEGRAVVFGRVSTTVLLDQVLALQSDVDASAERFCDALQGAYGGSATLMDWREPGSRLYMLQGERSDPGGSTVGRFWVLVQSTPPSNPASLRRWLEDYTRRAVAVEARRQAVTRFSIVVLCLSEVGEAPALPGGWECTVLRQHNLLRACTTTESADRAFHEETRRIKGLKVLSPYRTGGGLPPNSPVFKGRDAEIVEILSGLPNRSYLIVGGRRIGKTSLLNRLRALVGARPDTIPFYIDCAGLDRMEDFVIAVREAMVRDLPGMSGVQTLEDVRNVLGEAHTTLGRMPVLLLNEIDDLVVFGNAGIAAVKRLRSLHDQNVARLVMTGYKIALDAARGPLAPFFNFAEAGNRPSMILLGPFEYSAAQELVATLTRPPLSLRWARGFEIHGVSQIIERSYRVPWLLQQMLHALLERLDFQQRSVIVQDDIQHVVDQVGDQIWNYFRNIRYDELTAGPYRTAVFRERSQGASSDLARDGIFLVLTALARQLYFLGQNPAIIDSRRLAVSPRDSGLVFSPADATSALERTMKQLLLAPEREALNSWIRQIDFGAVMESLTLTMMLESVSGAGNLYQFSNHIFPKELRRRQRPDDPRLDHFFVREAADFWKLFTRSNG